MNRITMCAAIGGLMLASPVMAQAGDGAVRILQYAADAAQEISVGTGYAALIEFADDESIDNIIVGDSAGWQVTPTKRGDQLVVKPLGGGNDTNLIVTTNLRKYLFMLRPVAQGALLFRFQYPPKDAADRASQGNASFRFTGRKSLLPQRMYAEGGRTHIIWAANVPIPAIFAVDPSGTESLVNGRMVGSTYTIEGTSQRYIFRRGRQSAVAIPARSDIPR